MKVVAAEELPVVVIGDGSQRTAAMSGCHGEIAISQRRVAPRSAKSAAMTVAGRSCNPRGVPMPIWWRMTSPRLPSAFAERSRTKRWTPSAVALDKALDLSPLLICRLFGEGR